MKRKLTYPDKYWEFAREVLLEIKKQEKDPLIGMAGKDGIAFNVWCMIRKDNPITIENLGKY